MIKIDNNNGTWECWISGRIFEWNDNLEVLLRKLASQGKEIEEELTE